MPGPEELSPFFSGNPAPMLVCARSDLCLLAVNPAFERLYGFAAQEARALWLPGLHVAEERTRIAALAAEGRPQALDGEWRHLGRDEQVLHIIACRPSSARPWTARPSARTRAPAVPPCHAGSG